MNQDAPNNQLETASKLGLTQPGNRETLSVDRAEPGKTLDRCLLLENKAKHLLEKLKAEDITFLESEALRFSISNIENELAEIKGRTRAHGILIFQGRPVIKAQGIEADFGAKAIDRFQDAVLRRSARHARSVKAAIPHALSITGVVKGSFGFIIEELAPEDGKLPLEPSPLMQSLEEVQDAFSLALEGNRDLFIQAIRRLGGAGEPIRDFLKICEEREAIFSLGTPTKETMFDAKSIAASLQWCLEATSETMHEDLIGTLAGLMIVSRRFEFMPAGASSVIRGELASSADPHALASLLDRPVKAHLKKLVTKKAGRARSSQPKWVLESADPLPDEPGRML